MIVQDVLKAKESNDVVTVPRGATIADAVGLLQRWRIGALVVVDHEDHLCGIISERDVVRNLAQFGGQTLLAMVGEQMTQEVLVCQPDNSLEAVERTMTVNRIRHLPVVDGDRLVGIVTIGDLVKARLDEARHEVDQMREYVLLNH